jgi:hypothetical protein
VEQAEDSVAPPQHLTAPARRRAPSGGAPEDVRAAP